MVQKIITLILIALSLTSCQNTPKQLPILGEKIVDLTSGDIIYHTIPHFHLVDSKENNFCSDILSGKIYLADFFFTNCPSMCPRMTSSLKKIQGKFAVLHRLHPSIQLFYFENKEELTRNFWENYISDLGKHIVLMLIDLEMTF